MLFRGGAIAILLIFFLTGCSTTKPVTWKEQNLSFSDFNSFEILPVRIETGYVVEEKVVSFLNAQIKEQFEVKNLKLVDTLQTSTGVLSVQCFILLYEAHTRVDNLPTRKAQCAIRTLLIEKGTTRVVARILTLSEVGIEMRVDDTYKRVLKKAAAAVAEEVAKLIRSS